MEISHGNHGVIWWTEGGGELVLAQGITSKVQFVLFHLSLDLSQKERREGGGKGERREGGGKGERREGGGKGEREGREKGRRERREGGGREREERVEGREREGRIKDVPDLKIL